jgi:hypothetical protein
MTEPEQIIPPLANYSREKLERLVTEWAEYAELKASECHRDDWTGYKVGRPLNRYDFQMMVVAMIYLKSTDGK